MRDLFDFESPLGPLGRFAEALVLERYRDASWSTGTRRSSAAPNRLSNCVSRAFRSSIGSGRCMGLLA